MNINEIIGARIRSLREQRNEKQEGIAKLLGISRAAVSRYENGDRKPDYNTISILAQRFGVSTDYLLGVTDIPNTGLLPDDVKMFVSANIDLIRGGMSYEEMSRDICSKVDDPLHKTLFDTGYLKKLAKGRIQATHEIVQLLADYAGVDLMFFYRANTVEGLESARKEYAAAKAAAGSADALAEDLRKFVENSDNLPYIRLAMSLKKLNVDPERIAGMMEDFLNNPDDWKYIEFARDMKRRGIEPH